MIHYAVTSDSSPLRQEINRAYLADETTKVESLLEAVMHDGRHTAAVVSSIGQRAGQLIASIRQQAQSGGGIDALLREYDLSSHEGVALMCMAEALLRIPDADTADRLIKDKLADVDWESHLGDSHSLFVNASTWGLLLTGKLIRFEKESMHGMLNRLLQGGSDPVIRLATRQAMRIIGHQFVLGESIEEAIRRSRQPDNQAYLYYFDMLGESALSMTDAESYLQRYFHTLEVMAQTYESPASEFDAPGISVKLSALHPRFAFSQRERVIRELTPKVLLLAQKSRDAGVSLTIDAEEADMLDITLDVFEGVYSDKSLADWQGLGLAVQAYQKRAIPVIKWLEALAKDSKRCMMMRLIKGAYWDSEIKLAQEQGLADYPVFTRKESTDLSYLACIHQIIAAGQRFYPQFATHNAYTVATVQTLMPSTQDYEFQRLHGMGQSLYDELLQSGPSIRCRVYGPVGNHADLLPYLVRRLLENGSNTSFVNRIEHADLPIDELIGDPAEMVSAFDAMPHPAIPLPRQLFGNARLNSSGMNLFDVMTLKDLEHSFSKLKQRKWQAAPLISGAAQFGQPIPVHSPSSPQEVVGKVVESTIVQVEQALAAAHDYRHQWASQPVAFRAQVIERAAELFELHSDELMYLCIHEAGRGIKDSQSEVRESVDSCRYYAQQARETLVPQALDGPTGETNTLDTHGRGVMVCISPWNFPVAIFASQVIAALMAGNTVIAKPAHQTPLTAMRVVELLHEAGVPVDALHLLTGRSGVVGEPLLQDERVAGVLFTGSTATANLINRTLAQRQGAIVPLVAETGGQNAMIVDSSALAEQVVSDVIASAFNSAGQRCSALRVLFLQDDVAPRIVELLSGAMAELQVGDPQSLATDVGPLIDAAAKAKVMAHIDHMQKSQTLVCRAPIDAALSAENYLAPVVFEISDLGVLKQEVFGPVLHIIRYASPQLDEVIDQINATQFGLTLGIHSRIEERIEHIVKRARLGNIYVNRNMIGAVVGVQPFGGQGLSGTGPKAGGPNYLQRLVHEQTVSINTAAIGGNASLLNL